MNKPLNQSHLVFMSDRPLDLPQSITRHIGQVTPIIGKGHRFFQFFNTLQLNWRIRNLHATNPIDAIIIDHPQFASENLRSFTRKFNLPLIANDLDNTFDRNIVTRNQYSGFLLPSMFMNGDQTSTPIEAHSAVVPLMLTSSKYWNLAGYKSKILTIAVVDLNTDAAESSKLMTALDVVKSIDTDITVDVINPNDQNPEPLTKRLRKAHLIINIARDPAWIETAAIAVAAGIPLISPKRPIHQYIHPKDLPGYIVADWQIDTLTTIIQNSITHPEETYRVAKNAQHWLKSNLGNTFLPLSWVSGLNQLLSPAPETKQLS